MTNNTLWQKKMPTLLGLILIIIGIGVTSYLVNKGIIFTSKASPSQNPENIKITNVSDSAFTVTYTTQDNVFGSINYGASSSLGQTALDDRDSVSRAIVPHQVHSITANNLTSATTYYFSITSADSKYLNGTTPFSIQTGPQIQTSPSAQKPATGKIVLPDGTPASESLVYLFDDQSQVISTLTKSDGSYILPLNSLRTKDFSSYEDLAPDSTLKMIVVTNTLSSNILLSTSQINPIPAITLSNNYDFTTSGSPVSSQSAQIASSSGFPKFSTGDNFTPTIQTPTKNEGLSDTQPDFTGTGAPNQTVIITIHSNSPITSQVTTDANGNWEYRPNTPLSPGNHTITIQTKDQNGILKTITQSFTVYAAGTQIANTSTTQATLSTTPTPIPTPTPTQSPTQTPTPTLILTPTASAAPTTIAVLPLSPTPIAPTITPPPTNTILPSTGNSNIFGIGIFGIGITIIGGLLFILTRGGIPL